MDTCSHLNDPETTERLVGQQFPSYCCQKLAGNGPFRDSPSLSRDENWLTEGVGVKLQQKFIALTCTVIWVEDNRKHSPVSRYNSKQFPVSRYNRKHFPVRRYL